MFQSEHQTKSRHYNSKYCHSGCPMCSNRELRRGNIIPMGVFKGRPVTKVVHPLKYKCGGARKVQYIIHNEDGPEVTSVLLQLSGDVESNPGPGNKLSALHVYNSIQSIKLPFWCSSE